MRHYQPGDPQCGGGAEVAASLVRWCCAKGGGRGVFPGPFKDRKRGGFVQEKKPMAQMEHNALLARKEGAEIFAKPETRKKSMPTGRGSAHTAIRAGSAGRKKRHLLLAASAAYRERPTARAMIAQRAFLIEALPEGGEEAVRGAMSNKRI